MNEWTEYIGIISDWISSPGTHRKADHWVNSTQSWNQHFEPRRMAHAQRIYGILLNLTSRSLSLPMYTQFQLVVMYTKPHRITTTMALNRNDRHRWCNLWYLKERICSIHYIFMKTTQLSADIPLRHTHHTRNLLRTYVNKYIMRPNVSIVNQIFALSCFIART